MKNFDEIYRKICEENPNPDKFSEIKEQSINNPKIKKTLLTLFEITSISLFVLLVLLEDYIEKFPRIFVFAVTISAIFSVFLLSRPHSNNKKTKKENPYFRTYKETIISSLVKNYDPNLSFDAVASITKNTYNNAEFTIGSYFSSNDYIYGKINGIVPIKISDIRTTREDGSVVFQGLFSMVYLPINIQGTTIINKDYAPIKALNEDMESLLMDSQEFENNFDIFTNNKNMTMRILTADTMNFMLNFKTQNNVNFEVTVKERFAYIRLACNDMFEANLSKNAFDYDTLYTYYKYLDFICELNKKIFNTIKEKDL